MFAGVMQVGVAVGTNWSSEGQRLLLVRRSEESTRKHRQMCRMKLEFVEDHAWLDSKLKVIWCYHSSELISEGKIGTPSLLYFHQRVTVLQLKAKTFHWNDMCRTLFLRSAKTLLSMKGRGKNGYRGKCHMLLLIALQNPRVF